MNSSLLLKRLEKLFQVIRSIQLLKPLILNHVLVGAEHRHIFQTNLATAVDVGANRGQFALAVKRWAPKARIISFEPLNNPAATFLNVFRSEPNVTLYQTAIGPQVGETTIHVTASNDSSSLLPVSTMQKRIFPGTNVIRTEIVKIGPLSNYVSPEEIVFPALLKLDVQGYELKALHGCKELLNHFSYIYVECSFIELYTGQALVDEIMAWLRERGWVLTGIYNMTYDRQGRSIQADFLFSSLIKNS